MIQNHYVSAFTNASKNEYFRNFFNAVNFTPTNITLFPYGIIQIEYDMENSDIIIEVYLDERKKEIEVLSDSGYNSFDVADFNTIQKAAKYINKLLSKGEIVANKNLRSNIDLIKNLKKIKKSFILYPES